MQNTCGYKICDLVDKSKEIVIKCFYNDALLFRGKFEDVPTMYRDVNMRLFTPYETYFEFYI